MKENMVLVCEHHNIDIVFFRYEWPRFPGAPPLLVLESGNETLSFLQRCAENSNACPSLVLCEFQLPRGGGLEILKYIKSTNTLRHVPVVLMGKSVSPSARNAALQSGALEIWDKPVSSDTLRRILSTVVDLRDGSLGRVPHTSQKETSQAEA